MATDIGLTRPSAGARLPRTLVHAPHWTRAAWGAIAVTAAFLGITCWWLTQDRAIPIFDAGLHLIFVIEVHQLLSSGNLGNALTVTAPNPPLA
jgi:hypothetical protein